MKKNTFLILIFFVFILCYLPGCILKYLGGADVCILNLDEMTYCWEYEGKQKKILPYSLSRMKWKYYYDGDSSINGKKIRSLSEGENIYLGDGIPMFIKSSSCVTEKIVVSMFGYFNPSPDSYFFIEAGKLYAVPKMLYLKDSVLWTGGINSDEFENFILRNKETIKQYQPKCTRSLEGVFSDFPLELL